MWHFFPPLWFCQYKYAASVFLQVEVLFELIKGLIKDLDGPPVDEVPKIS